MSDTAATKYAVGGQKQPVLICLNSKSGNLKVTWSFGERWSYHSPSNSLRGFLHHDPVSPCLLSSPPSPTRPWSPSLSHVPGPVYLLPPLCRMPQLCPLYPKISSVRPSRLTPGSLTSVSLMKQPIISFMNHKTIHVRLALCYWAPFRNV